MNYLETLRRRAAVAQKQVAALEQTIETLKADLGDLTNKTADYLALSEEERALRESIRQIDEQILLMSTPYQAARKS